MATSAAPASISIVGVSNEKGLSNVVNGEMAWREALQMSEGLPHLKCCPPGRPRGVPRTDWVRR